MARLTITEAAQRLNLSPDSIRRRIRKGELPAQRDNKGQWWCELPDDPQEAAPDSAPGCIAPTSLALPYAPMQGATQAAPPLHSDALADLRSQVADLSVRLDRAETERGRLLTLIETMTALLAATPGPADTTRPALLVWLRDAWRRVAGR